MNENKNRTKVKPDDKETYLENIELIPPDGGWGWAVVLATALGCIIVIPALQVFALLYRERFVDLGLTATDISVIINVNSAFGMLLGLFHGSVLNRFGYRKVSAAGSLIAFLGFFLTSFANSFIAFYITYGLITSIGATIIYPSYQLALTMYFTKRRGKAMGFATTIMGIGFIILPPLTSYLLSIYGEVGTAVIVAALSLHSLVGSVLLQPIKWHMKKKVVDSEAAIQETANGSIVENQPPSEYPLVKYGSRQLSVSIDHDMDAQSIYGFESPMASTTTKNSRRMSQGNSCRSRNRVTSQSESLANTETSPTEEKTLWFSAASSLNKVDISGSNVKLSNLPLHEADEENEDKIDNEPAVTPLLINEKTSCSRTHDMSDVVNEITIKKNQSPKKRGLLHRVLMGIIKELDLTIMKDRGYLNLMIGMSLAVAAEINFSFMTPLFLGALGFSYDDTAILMAIIATADLVFRFLTPFFADWMQYDARRMYVISLFMLIISRSTMIFCTSFKAMVGVSLAIGIGRGVRTVYMLLVIPSYVPIERLPSASGLQMAGNGIVLLTFGPILGFVKDLTGSYNSCIVVINLLTTSTLVMWLTESSLKWFRQRKSKTKR